MLSFRSSLLHSRLIYFHSNTHEECSLKTVQIDLQLFCHIYSFIFVLDADECSTNSHSCDVNAVCSNTRGSYTCTCKAGYTGDGKSCTGG